jgi:hypothetical protein
MNKYLTISILLIISGAFNLNAQLSTLKITDGKAPLPYSYLIVNRTSHCVADSSGMINLADYGMQIVTGDSITVKYLGFKPLILKVTAKIAGLQHYTFALQPDIYQMDEIIISAAAKDDWDKFKKLKSRVNFPLLNGHSAAIDFEHDTFNQNNSTSTIYGTTTYEIGLRSGIQIGELMSDDFNSVSSDSLKTKLKRSAELAIRFLLDIAILSNAPKRFTCHYKGNDSFNNSVWEFKTKQIAKKRLDMQSSDECTLLFYIDNTGRILRVETTMTVNSNESIAYYLTANYGQYKNHAVIDDLRILLLPFQNREKQEEIRLKLKNHVN